MALFSASGYAAWKFNQSMLVDRIEVARRKLTEFTENGGQFDAIAVIGTSGVWMAGAIVAATGMPFLLLRKEGENTHGTEFEGPGNLNIRRVVLLDDFVSSGSTVRNAARRLWDRGVLVTHVITHDVGDVRRHLRGLRLRG